MSADDRLFESYYTIPFPLKAESDDVGRRRSSEPVLIGPKLIEYLLPEELFTYARLVLWHQRGEAMNLARLADECWSSHLDTADYWVSQLKSCGLVQDADEYAAELRAEMEQRRAEQEARAQAAAAHVVAYLDGRWQGQWPLTLRQDFPLLGVPVVYFMYDTKGRLAYIGSSKQFRKRMEQHADTPRCEPWVRWEARECRTRKEAYDLEAREIAARKPYQNGPGMGAARGADFVRWAQRNAR